MTSETKSIYAKIALVQGTIGAISKDATGSTGGRNYKYFDINTLLHELIPILGEKGLALIQPLVHLDGKPAIRTIVADVETGEAIEFDTPIPPSTDPQKHGSAVTYMRRYCLQSLFALQSDDDDGKAASIKAEKKAHQKALEGAVNGSDLPDQGQGDPTKTDAIDFDKASDRWLQDAGLITKPQAVRFGVIIWKNEHLSEDVAHNWCDEAGIDRHWVTMKDKDNKDVRRLYFAMATSQYDIACKWATDYRPKVKKELPL